MKKLSSSHVSNNVFLDLGFSPEEAKNLALRGRIMNAVKRWYDKTNLTQAAAAKALQISQPRLNALLKGKIAEFSLDALVGIATTAGLDVAMQIKPISPLANNPNSSQSSSKRPKKVAAGGWIRFMRAGRPIKR